MNFIKVKTYEELSKKAANIIAAQMILKPESVLGLATGSTPIGTYKELIKAYNNGDIDFSSITTVNLDEYAGLEGTHDQSYRYFMNSNLFNHVNIDINNTYVPNGCAEDFDAECKIYDERIKAVGGIDIQLLGIGLDGHIGFNEPADYFEKGTHIVDLHPSTIEANSRFFESIDLVPRKAITMGIGSIMQAKKILLIANGKNKEDILNKSFFGPVTPQVPASILQLHNDLTVIYSEN